MTSFNIDYSVPSEYTYDTNKIEVASGKAELKLIEGSPIDYITDMDNTTRDNSVYDNDKVEWTGTKVQKKFNDLPAQTFNQTFDSDVGFTYDVVKTEFSGGQIQQINQTPVDAIFYAGFESINANWSDGSNVGTLFGSASIGTSKLILPTGTDNYIRYVATNNIPLGNTGTIRIEYRPQYSGSPGINQRIWFSSDAIDNLGNLIGISHIGTNIKWEFYNSAGVLIKTIQTGNTFNPIAGTLYEIEINFTTSPSFQARLFINGVNINGLQGGAGGTRNQTTGIIHIGKDNTSVPSSIISSEVENVLVFDTIQHTTNYTPDWTNIPLTRYVEDLITFPNFVYSGIGDIQAYTSLIVNQVNNAKFNINGQYWNGASWVASDDSYAQMNNASIINTNLSSLSLNDTISFKMIMEASNSQTNVSNLDLTYTGQTYLASNVELPEIEHLGPGAFKTWSGYIATDSNARYTFQLDKSGDYLYWNGSAVAISDGSYAQSNDATTINTNKASLGLDEKDFIQFKIHFDDSDTQMNVEQTTFSATCRVYSTDSPTIYKTLGDEKSVLNWLSFIETLGSGNQGNIFHQLSLNGSTWQYWNGSNWVDVINPTDYNTASEININIKNFTDNKTLTFYVKSFLVSDGSQKVELENIQLIYVHQFDCPLIAQVQDEWFQAKKENSCTINLLMKDKDDNIITDLSLANSIKFMLKYKQTDDDSDALITKDLNNGIFINNPVTGNIRIILESTDLNINIGDYFAGIEIIWDDNVREACFKVEGVLTNIYSIVQDVIRG